MKRQRGLFHTVAWLAIGLAALVFFHGASAGAASFVVIDLPGPPLSVANGVASRQQVGVGVAPPFDAEAPRRALLWTGNGESVVDLGFPNSEALGVSAGQQVGYGADPGYLPHALLWTGSAASVVDLHPAGFTSSAAYGVSAGQQVGAGSFSPGGLPTHALLWTGSAESVVDLHPRDFD
ncbi:MAG TPA: hypothetical protein VN203_29260, partial [Candidatus Acidoferrum sp.]|nr:hypothetical protein [Candidatus Acidoferrum sp.]